jgi:uncharacterized Zn-binding protein involved in type VI secretion
MGQPAARITDMHVCPMVTGVVPHVGGPIALGCFTVFTQMLPQARISDMCVCVGPPDIIAKGSAGVLVGGLPAARMGDMTAHGGTIVLGCFTVLIGETGGGGGGGGGGGAGAGGNADNAYEGGGAAFIEYSKAEDQASVLKQAGENGTPFCEICFGS